MLLQAPGWAREGDRGGPCALSLEVPAHNPFLATSLLLFRFQSCSARKLSCLLNTPLAVRWNITPVYGSLASVEPHFGHSERTPELANEPAPAIALNDGTQDDQFRRGITFTQSRRAPVRGRGTSDWVKNKGSSGFRLERKVFVSRPCSQGKQRSQFRLVYSDRVSGQLHGGPGET